jgi:hypothetical protein
MCREWTQKELAAYKDRLSSHLDSQLFDVSFQWFWIEHVRPTF